MWKAFLIGLLTLVFPVVGLGVLLSSWQMVRAAQVTRQWPTTHGDLRTSELVMEEARSLTGPANSRRTPTKVYTANVHYVYEVDGVSYEGRRIGLYDTRSTDKHAAELLVDAYRPGPIEVHYNPADPASSVLDPGNWRPLIPGFVIGGALAIVPPLLIVLGLKLGHIEPPELPLALRVWLQARRKDPPPAPPEHEATEDSCAPKEGDFQEEIVVWRLGDRVELGLRSPSVWAYALLSCAVGAIVAWVGMMPVTKLVFPRETLHLPELRTVAVALFATAAAITFCLAQLRDRSSQMVINWREGSVHIRSGFSRTRELAIRDVEKVIVRCVPFEGRPTRYLADIELVMKEECFRVARTWERRRKQASARERALEHAEPLAASLHVELETVGWTDG